MSRFSHLEFGDHSEESLPTQPRLKDAGYYVTLASECFHRGKFEEALRAFGKVLEFDPNNSTAWAGQVRMLIELEEFSEAKLWADKASEKFPSDPEILAVKAVTLARTGDSEAAMLFSDAAVEARSDLPYVWLARGDVLLARGERRADICFDRARSLAPRDWSVRWLISRIYAFYEQTAKALKVALEGLEMNSVQAVLWAQAGTCHLALGLHGAAGNAFQQAQQLDPDCRPPLETRRALANPSAWHKLKGLWRRLFQK